MSQPQFNSSACSVRLFMPHGDPDGLRTGLTFSPANINVADYQNSTITLTVSDARSGAGTAKIDTQEGGGVMLASAGAIIDMPVDFTRDNVSGTVAVFRGNLYPPSNLAAGTCRLAGLH